MEIDNSRANAFKQCPWMYYEQFVKNIELIPKGEVYGPLEYGDREHQLLETHYGGQEYPPASNELLEAEAQLMIEAYKAKYPQEEFEVVDRERSFKVALPRYCTGCYAEQFEEWQHFCSSCGAECSPIQHILIGKIDLTYRDKNDGYLYIIDHKTEKRGAKSNLPQRWAEKDQASLYLWAAERIYGEKPKNFIVNVLTRQSEKGLVGPSFPERQKLERSQGNIDHAVRDIVFWADRIEECEKIFGKNPWPANREKCFGEFGTYPCEFQLIHGYGVEPGDTELIEQLKYRQKKEYLHLGGVPIIQ